MKNGTFLTLILLAFGAGIATYEYDPTCFGLFDAPAKPKAGKPAKVTKVARADKKTRHKAPTLQSIPGSYIGNKLHGREWADTPVLEKKLAESILAKLKGTSREEVQAFIAEPENRLMLAQWHLAATENAVSPNEYAKAREEIAQDIDKRKANLSQLREDIAKAADMRLESLKTRLKDEEKAIRSRETELASPRSMREAMASSPGTINFVQQVTNNLDWMEQIVYSGECLRPGRSMGILAAIAREHEGLASQKMQREIATATAVEWAKSGWDFEKALARADFYIRNWEDDRFHTEFDTIPFWMRRMICGSKGNNAYGEVASLQWQLDNVNLPTERYSGCCWQCSYRLNNLFGDSIHGPMYYNPYMDVYGDNAAQRTYDVGGVCGSLSHFGAFAALANGIPAMTAGEPGHCAYIVWSNNKWQPGYSLSWQRGLHWQVWSGIHKFASLHMATELYSDAQQEKTRLSNACWTLGKLYASRGEKEKALTSFVAALEEQPRNYGAWVDYARFLKKAMPQDTDAWKQLNATACAALAPLYPEMAAELMKTHIYPGMKEASLPAGELMECFAAFWKALDAMGPDRWDIEALCGAQADTLKAGGGKAEECSLALYEAVLGLCADKAAYAPVILSWGNGIASGMKPEMQQKFLKATLAGLSKGGEMDAASRDKMLGQALAGAARMRDRSSFQAIGKMLSADYKKNRLPKWQPFPGKLASQGGLLYASSSAHDDPAAHWGVLEPTGGRFHTASEVGPWVTVELPKMVYVTGVVAVSTAGYNNRRIHDMKVQYSESGKEGDWHEAGAFPAPSTREVNRLDLNDKKPRARFIRIIRGGEGKDVFHLNGIFVYGEQAA